MVPSPGLMFPPVGLVACVEGAVVPVVGVTVEGAVLSVVEPLDASFMGLRQAVIRLAIRTNTRAMVLNFFMVFPPFSLDTVLLWRKTGKFKLVIHGCFAS